MPCRKCKGEEATKPYCSKCVALFVSTIKNKGPALQAAAIDFARRGEQSYLDGNVVYSDQAKGADANHGSAFGFRASSKVFTLLTPGTASISIEKFISPIGSTRTVCECKTFMLAVYYNAIRTVLEDLHPQLFDLVFDKLTLTPDPGDDVRLKGFFTIKSIAFSQEFLVRAGDWLYVANPSVTYSEVNIQVTGGKGQSGAAGGWNLVCVSTVPNKYLGLGLTDLSATAPKEQSLSAILDYMYQEGKTKEVVTKDEWGVKPRARSGSLDLKDEKTDQKRLVHLTEQKKRPRLYQLSASLLAETVADSLR
ncbi:MAG TPA: hypothetical protein VFH68_26105 [Polyangia bacterium]|jgi:hypothetical protein|nr:hypothetical protein [Polyangia bacterium]